MEQTILQDMAAAIDQRKSVRKFTHTPVKEEEIDQLRDWIRAFDAPFAHRVELDIVESDHFYYFREPVYSCLFSVPNRSYENQAKAGFVGELFILYAVSLGIGTCWNGHYKHKGVARAAERIGQKNDVIAVTPLGYPAGALQLSERIFTSRKKPVEKSLTGTNVSVLPDVLYQALQKASMAPSAMNSQCWNFTVERNRDYWTVAIYKPEDYTHFKWDFPDVDVGTSAAHFWISLKALGVEPFVRISTSEWHAKWTFQIPVTAIEIEG